MIHLIWKLEGKFIFACLAVISMSVDQTYCSSEAPALPQNAVSQRTYRTSSSAHYVNASRMNLPDRSRSFQSNGPTYYSHSRAVAGNAIPEASRDTNHAALNGFLDDIGSRVSVGRAPDSVGSLGGSGGSSGSGASSNSARSVVSAPQVRIGSRLPHPPPKCRSFRKPNKINVKDAAARAGPQKMRPMMKSPGAGSVSSASVCSSRSGFSGLSGESPTLPSGFKLRCRSLRPGEPLPHGPGWFDVTKGFCGSVNALKKSLLAGQMKFVSDVHGYFIRSTRRSIEQHRDVYYLLWREEPELRPRGEWEGLRKDIKYVPSKYI